MKTLVKVFKTKKSYIKNQCYLIYNDRIGVLIDPAWEYDSINEFIVNKSIRIGAILLTHSHFDHVNLAEKFALKYKIPVYMSDDEVNIYGFSCSNLKLVKHLERISIENLKILPIVTPGHTLGSTCYLIENNLFSGDTIFIEGVGICNRNDAYKLFDSVQFLKNYLSNDILFWPGHSFGELPGKNLGYLRRNNIYFQFKKAQNFVEFRTRKNRPNPFIFQ